MNIIFDYIDLIPFNYPNSLKMKTLAIPLLRLVKILELLVITVWYILRSNFTHVIICYNWQINTPSCVTCIGFVHNYHFILYFEVISFTVV